MRRYIIVAILFALTWAACSKDSGPRLRLGTWQHHEEALAAAKRAGKRAILDVSAQWCTPCLELERVTFADPDVKRALSDWVLVRLDVTRAEKVHEEIQWRYQAETLPMVVLYDERGVEVRRISRFITADELLTILESPATPAN